MRNHYLLLLLLFPISVFSQIHFQKGDLASAFGQAKTEGKPLFIMIHADGCPHCENFFQTFKRSKRVSDYYNETFINYKIEVNSDEGKAFRKQFGLNVMSTPLLTFWKTDSTLLALYPSGEEQNNENEIVEMGKKSLDTHVNWPAQLKAFKRGLTQPGFLVNLAFTARFVSDTLLNISAMNKYADYLQSSGYQDDGFMVLNRVIMDDENPVFMHALNNRQRYYEKYGEDEVNRVLERIVMISLYSSRSADYNLSRLKYMQAALKSAGIDELSISGRFFLAETRYYFKNGMSNEAIGLLKEYCKKRKTLEGKEAEYLQSYFSKNLTENDLINQVSQILKNTTKINTKG